MTKKDPGRLPKQPALAREDRLKAALKANMAKRKAQTRARQAESAEDKDAESGQKGED